MNKIGRSFQEEANLTMERYLNDSYFSPRQWISYCGQINAVRRVSPKTLLEIGVGNGIVYKILEHLGIKVTTYDININLNPTVVGNILDIDNYFEAGSFDCVLCAEVLEHLPFNLFEKCLGKIAYLTRKSSIITLPRAGTNLIYCSGEHPRGIFDFLLRLPSSRIGIEHHWEIDNEDYSMLNNIITLMSQYFDVEDYYRIPEHPNHYAFILEKKIK